MVGVSHAASASSSACVNRSTILDPLPVNLPGPRQTKRWRSRLAVSIIHYRGPEAQKKVREFGGMKRYSANFVSSVPFSFFAAVRS
jgi:hypothetical protein